jgi:protoporphyrinogen oxidase
VTVGIIGGGIMGISLGYFLSRQGLKVEIYEASPTLGGLAGPLILPDGVAVDRFYHAILSSDSHLRELCAELGIADQMRFKETRMGFYYQGRVHSMNGIVEFLRFPPLGWIDRFRLGLTVLYAQLIRDWHPLEAIGVEDWLVRVGGRRAFENIWRPMLRAKFDGSFADTPATYIWSRLVRMKSTRGGAEQKEMAGHVIGGYHSLMKAMAAQIEARGGKIFLRRPVEGVAIERGHARGIRIDGEVRPFSAVVATLQAPIFSRLIPDANPQYLELLAKTEYLGIICPLLVLDRPLTGYWTINITDERVPFTGVIETTSYIDPQYLGGHHLVYLPKYTAPGSPWVKKSDEEIREIWMSNLEAMFPSFDRSWVRYFLIHRERYVEPLHTLNSTHLMPAVQTPVEHLYLATTAQIYPALTNGESVTRHARLAAQVILNELSPASVQAGAAEAMPATGGLVS